MSKFNSSISTVGIKDPKVQQAILKLLENSLYQRQLIGKVSGDVNEEVRLLKQKLSTLDLDIDDKTAQEIAEKISAAIGDSVKNAVEAAESATSAASAATKNAAQASADAKEVKDALADIEGTIEKHAETAAQKAAESAVATATQNATAAAQNAQTAAQNATAAANTATQKATAATQSAQNAATTASQAEQSATNAAKAINDLRIVNLTVATSRNTTNDQYRKIATFPVVDGAYGAFVTIFGSIGGVHNSAARPIYLSISQRQEGSTFTDLDVYGYAFRASLPQYADIVLYKESNNTFSLYLKGIKNTYFKHNLSMMCDENVTVVKGSYTTTVPTGTLVWSLLANHKVVSTKDELDTAIKNIKSTANTWTAAQTFSAAIKADNGVNGTGKSCSYYQGRDRALFKTTVSTEGYVPIISVKSHTGSWEIGTYQAANTLRIVHITDANHDASQNAPSVNIYVTEDGKIIGVKSPDSGSNDTSVPTTAWVRGFAAPKSHTHDYAPTNHTHNYAPDTREYVAWSHVNVDLANSTFLMAGLVSNSSATYNVRVTFLNTASTARTVTANGTSASLPSGNGKTVAINFTKVGNGTFTIDNIASSVDVFVRIWR